MSGVFVKGLYETCNDLWVGIRCLLWTDKAVLGLNHRLGLLLLLVIAKIAAVNRIAAAATVRVSRLAQFVS